MARPTCRGLTLASRRARFEGGDGEYARAMRSARDAHVRVRRADT